jgi:hypothetical protein
LKFDLVMGQMIAQLKDLKQRQQVLDWVQQQQKAERQCQMDSTIDLAATTIAGLGSLVFWLGELALVFGAAEVSIPASSSLPFLIGLITLALVVRPVWHNFR